MPIRIALVFGMLLCMVPAVAAASAAAAAESENAYTQSYAVLMKGEIAGSETVSEKDGNAGERVATSEHELYVTDRLETKRMAFSTKMVLSKSTLMPISYEHRYTTGSADSYEVLVKDGQVTRLLNRSGRSSEVSIPVPPNMVMVDVNVYYQFDYIIRRYDAKKGGRQLFANFVPVNGSDIPLAVTFLGTENLELGSHKLPVRNFRIEFVNIWSGTLSVDQNNRLVRWIVPAQDLQVIRTDLLLEK